MPWVTQATDDFNRANETPLAGNWTTTTGEAGVNLSGNVVIPSSMGSDCGARYSGRAWANDQFSSAILTCTGIGGTDGPGFSVRVAAGARTYYRFTLNHSVSVNAEMRRFIAGVSTLLDSWTQSWTDGDKFTYRVSGPASAAKLEVVLNDVAVVRSFTDNSTIASGSPGIDYSSTETAATWDNWEGGELVAASSDPFEIGATGPPFWGG